MANTNAKTELNTFCQRHLKVPIGKADIVYTLQTFGEQHQATVTLNCMGGLQFSGEVAADLKQAQQNAAAAALSHHAAEIAALPAVTGKKRKAEEAAGRFQEAAGGAPKAAKAPKAAVAAVANPAITNKSTLNAAMGRILRRPLTKEDCKYETAKIGEGFQTTVSLPGLQGQWSQLAWAGELGETEKQAQENAAAHAVAALQADPTYGPMTLVAAKPAGAKQPGAKKGRVVQMSGGMSAAGVIRPNAAVKGGGNQQAWGKAMGKGKMMGNMGKGNMNNMSQGWGSGCGMGGMAMGNQMMAQGKGKGKDKGKGCKGGGSFGGGGGGGGSTGSVKVFVGGLPKSAPEASVQAFFASFGMISRFDFKYDEGGQPRGFCFVEYADSGIAHQVIQNSQAGQTMFEGKWLDCKDISDGGGGGGGKGGKDKGGKSKGGDFGKSGKRQKNDDFGGFSKGGGGFSKGGKDKGKGGGGKGDDACKLFVGGLPQGVTQEALSQHFMAFGSVARVDLKYDEEGGFRGFGFVTFSDASSVDLVTANDGNNNFQGKWIDCKPSGAPPGAGGGKDSGKGGKGGKDKGKSKGGFDKGKGKGGGKDKGNSKGKGKW